MKRIFDLIFALLLCIVLLIPMILIAISIRVDSRGPAIYWSKRVGRKDRIFNMPKFRSMRLGTPEIATHIIEDPDVYISSIGGFLRQYS